MVRTLRRSRRLAVLTVTTDGTTKRRFMHITAAGITFQGGSAAVDSSTIIAALVHQLTGSAIAVGAVTTILRVGWLSPQLIVGYLVQRRRASLPYFIVGAFGRAICLALLACLLAISAQLPTPWVVTGFFVGWTAYAFVSGIVAVPYNDIVGRSVPSEQRSRLLALRFFGGGVLGLGIAALADRLVVGLPFPASYAAVVGMAALLMCLSSILFVWPGEPTGEPAPQEGGFISYLRHGLAVFRSERAFRLFVFESGDSVLNSTNQLVYKEVTRWPGWLALWFRFIRTMSPSEAIVANGHFSATRCSFTHLNESRSGC